MTPKQLAEEAANKAWGEPQNGLASKGKMQDAVTAALSTFAEALAKEFRRLAAEALERQRRLPRKFVKDRYEYLGMAHAYKDAARRLEEEI